MAYDLIALQTDEAADTLDQLGQQLKQTFASDPNAEVLLEGEGEGRYLVARWKGWAFQVAYEAGPHVLEESMEIAEHHHGPDRPDLDRIAACRRRITVTGNEDPNMDHFNDYLLLEEVFKKLPGVILFDPQERAFVD